MSAADIKKFCKKLSAYNVKRIEAYYDGSGDSGDFEQIYIVNFPTPETIEHQRQLSSNPNSFEAQEGRISWRTWVKQITSKPDSLITQEDCDELYDSLFGLLPGGWEINDGSYGEISIDITDESIIVEHNERYTETRSETFRY
jgi:hypothetical protein